MIARLRTYLSFVRFSHSVFALPFALAGALLASRHTPITWPVVGWILVAMVAARSSAMGFNRLVDARFDAENPRTANREIPRGAMSRVESVQPLSTRIASQGEMEINGAQVRAFVVEASWRVNGRVTHWGHSHDRLTEYDGRFVVIASADGWRIHDAQITRQERVEDNATTPEIESPPTIAPEDEEL